MANLAGIGGLVTKIKDVIKKLRRPIDKAMEKVAGFVAGKARVLLGQKEKPVSGKEEESPEKLEKLSRGLTAIDQEGRKYLENNKISRENAEKVAATVKKAHPVFKSLIVVDGGDTWDYDYVASPGRIKEGPEKLEEKTGNKLEGQNSEKDQGFNTFKELKKALGSAGNNKIWHHIVEQSQIKKSRFNNGTKYRDCKTNARCSA